MPQISLAGRHFRYQVVRRSAASLQLHLNSPRSFTVNCHFLTPNFVITRFITEHQDWIIKHAVKVIVAPSLKKLKYLSILGDTYELIIQKMTRDSVVIFHDEHKIYLNTVSLTLTHLKKLLDKKLRPLALSLIKAELSTLSRQYGFKYSRVSVKNTTSRYGSCSSLGNLNFNWQIIFFPKPIFTHLLLHELTHLQIKNHSAKFWHQLTIYDPACHDNNLWLKREGQKYFLIHKS